MEVAAILPHRTRGHQFLIFCVAVGETRRADVLGQAARAPPRRVDRQIRKRRVLAAQKSGGMKCFHGVALAADLQVLADVDERRNLRIARPQRAGDHRAHVRRGHGLRRRIAGVPMELMPRMQNEPQIAHAVRANQRAAVHDFGDALQAGGDLDLIDGGVDRRERAQHALGFHARFKRRVALGIERFGLRHAASHPQQNQAIGARRDFRRAGQKPRFGPRQCGQSGAAGSAQKMAAGKPGHDFAFDSALVAVHRSYITTARTRSGSCRPNRKFRT